MSAPQKFQLKKPVTVEAMYWDGSEESQRAIVNWANGVVEGWFDDEYHLKVWQDDGSKNRTVTSMRADIGDWVVKGSVAFFVCKPDEFNALYEPVDA